MREINGPLSCREKANLYYELLAGGARTKLLESVINFNLAELLMKEGPMLESQLTAALQLHPLRARKWYFLLTREGFLRRTMTPEGYIYTSGPVMQELVGDNNERWWFFKQMTYSWQTIAYESFYNILRGADVNYDVNWPPHKDQDSIAIEEWMTKTNIAPLQSLERAVDFTKVRHLLDIGGGEGTMACTLAKKYPNLHVTIYNLPVAIQLAKRNIQIARLEDRVHVVEGDFFKDNEFPSGFDMVLFSRVLCDWSPETARRLLGMAYRALSPNGVVAICEAFQENNQDFSLAWEFRYVFWDAFETEVFKSSLTYKKILSDLGYKILGVSKIKDDSIYTVLQARKAKQLPFIQHLVSKWITRQYERMQQVGN